LYVNLNSLYNGLYHNVIFINLRARIAFFGWGPGTTLKCQAEKSNATARADYRVHGAAHGI